MSEVILLVTRICRHPTTERTEHQQLSIYMKNGQWDNLNKYESAFKANANMELPASCSIYGKLTAWSGSRDQYPPTIPTKVVTLLLYMGRLYSIIVINEEKMEVVCKRFNEQTAENVRERVWVGEKKNQEMAEHRSSPLQTKET